MGADKGNARRLHPCHVANGSLTAGAGRAGGWVASAERAFLPLLAHRAKGAACRSPLKTWTLFSFQDNFSVNCKTVSAQRLMARFCAFSF
ncbi:hypothetical protein DYO72_23725 [Salmonella enterica subsp. enterica serovar Montevideo]|uniref:Uncharacterized protein n=1 Tax=Salmonella montevideo TaxID=115981 RepID=A0A605DIZ3_SALMO|nr:hypothetical protein [Salmonella enterica subsp. enterica serovar Montevideo]